MVIISSEIVFSNKFYFEFDKNIGIFTVVGLCFALVVHYTLFKIFMLEKNIVSAG